MEHLKSILVPPIQPIEVRTLEDWTEKERELGTTLPTDYKKFIETYGGVGINEFLWIFTPFTKYENVNLIQKAEEMTRYHDHFYSYDWYDTALGAFIKQEPDRELFPKPGGLLLWGVTDNGDEFFWRTEGHPDQWPIRIYPTRSYEFVEYNMTLTEFLYQLLSKQIHVEWLEEALEEALTFTPYES